MCQALCLRLGVHQRANQRWGHFRENYAQKQDDIFDNSIVFLCECVVSHLPFPWESTNQGHSAFHRCLFFCSFFELSKGLEACGEPDIGSFFANVSHPIPVQMFMSQSQAEGVTSGDVQDHCFGAQQGVWADLVVVKQKLMMYNIKMTQFQINLWRILQPIFCSGNLQTIVDVQNVLNHESVSQGMSGQQKAGILELHRRNSKSSVCCGGSICTS